MSAWTPDTGGDLSTTTTRSRHSTATLEGSSTSGPLSYSPDEADTHYHRYSGGRTTARSTSVLQDLQQPEEEARAEHALLNGEEDEEEEEEEEDVVEQEEEDTGSDRGEEAVEVPVVNLPDSLKERLEGDMRAIQGKLRSSLLKFLSLII